MTRRTRAILISSASLTAGAALGAWLWRRWGYPVRAVAREVLSVPEPPVTAEPPGERDIQREEDGVGARFHRRYEVDVEKTTKSPVELIRCIGENIQAYVPDELATFEKSTGVEGQLAIGDEYDIHIRSPWDGPVRVVEAEPTRFTLATLDGHMEAGQIRFEAVEHPTVPDALRFSIESWARSRDGAVDFVYDELGLAKKAQQAMWTFFCERVADDCGGQKMEEVRVLTEREPSPDEDDRQPEADDG